MALNVDSLRKSYAGNEVVAGLSFAVPPGTCFGLLGPNGAGKTTTLRLCLGLTAPDSGSVTLNGHAIPADAQQARARIGVVPQFDNLDPDFTASENLLVFGRYFGLKDAEVKERIPQLLDFAGLTGKADARIATLSGGMKRRLTLARSLVNNPDIVFLDEPTTGLDPQARHLIWERLKQLKSAGKTLILTTHFMDEAERLCDRLIVIDHGKKITEGSPRQLIAEHIEPQVIEVFDEASRNLLKSWFLWLRESATAQQWAEQSALLGKQAKALRRRLQLGDASQLESIQTEAAQAQAEAQLTQARVRQRIAGEDLRRRYPGLPISEPESIATPGAVSGSAEEWINRILEHSHELGLARGEAQRAMSQAGRSSRERLPDPTVGLQISRERGGEENVMGAYISIPLPGSARQASSDASRAQVGVASSREAAVRQRIEAEAAQLYDSAVAAVDSWQSNRIAAEHLNRAAEMTARTYQLGEGTLGELLSSRRLANDAQLAARLSQLEALELHYRLQLDAHQLWDFD